MELRTRTLKGISWTSIAQIIRIILNFVVVAILARLLTPEDFGLVAMVLVFSNLMLILNDLGLPYALIYQKDLTEETISSTFWFNLAEGLLISLLFLGLAPLIAAFYGREELVPIVMVMASLFLITSFGNIQNALFAKAMRFKIIAIAEMIAIATGGFIAVGMAYAGFGVWSLVFQQVLMVFFLAALLFFLSDWRPKFMFKWRSVRGLFGFGFNLTGYQLVNYTSRNADYLLIGKFLGSVSLGYYSLAYRISLYPLHNLGLIVGRVMFPALSTIQDSEEQVRRAYTRATRYIAIVVFPILIGILVLAPLLVRVAFGPQWERSILLVQVLAAVCLQQSLVFPVSWIYQSQGRTDIMFRFSLVATAVSVAAFAIGLIWDVEGVAIAYAIASFLLAYPAMAIPFRLINLRFLTYMAQFSRVAAATAVMGGATYAARLLLEKYTPLNNLVILIICIAILAFSYLGMLLLIDRNSVRELRQFLRDVRSSEQGGDEGETGNGGALQERGLPPPD